MYRDLRKLRAPTAMMKRLGVTPPRPRGDVGQTPLVDEEGEVRKPDLLFPAPGGAITAPASRVQQQQQEDLQIQMQQQEQLVQQVAPGQQVGVQSPGGSGGSMSVGMPSSDGMPDDLMADIDWVSDACLHAWLMGSRWLTPFVLYRMSGIDCSHRRSMTGSLMCLIREWSRVGTLLPGELILGNPL